MKIYSNLPHNVSTEPEERASVKHGSVLGFVICSSSGVTAQGASEAAKPHGLQQPSHSASSDLIHPSR